MPKIITKGANLHCTLDGWARGLSCFGLAHTFDFRDSKRCEIGYRYTKTNNMLDYSHHVGIERNSLFLFAVDVYKSLLLCQANQN